MSLGFGGMGGHGLADGIVPSVQQEIGAQQGCPGMVPWAAGVTQSLLHPPQTFPPGLPGQPAHGSHRFPRLRCEEERRLLQGRRERNILSVHKVSVNIKKPERGNVSDDVFPGKQVKKKNPSKGSVEGYGQKAEASKALNSLKAPGQQTSWGCHGKLLPTSPRSRQKGHCGKSTI